MYENESNLVGEIVKSISKKKEQARQKKADALKGMLGIAEQKEQTKLEQEKQKEKKRLTYTIAGVVIVIVIAIVVVIIVIKRKK